MFNVYITDFNYLTRLTSLATQHVASDVIFFGTSIVFLDLKGVG